MSRPDARLLPLCSSSRTIEAISAGSDLLSTPSDSLFSSLSACLDALPEPAVLVDHLHTVRACNARATSLFRGLEVGLPLEHTMTHEGIFRAIAQTQRDFTPRRVEFIERVPFDRHYEAYVSPVSLPEAGSNRMLMLTVRDLTQQHRLEQMRADFVANASHELRTPLAALSGFIETLQGAARDDAMAREKFLAIMQVQAVRMSRLIDDLLSLSRIEMNVHLRPEKPVDLMKTLASVVDTLAALAQDRSAEIYIQSSNSQLLVPGDADELFCLFENLIENALKYGASGGRVDIEVQRVAHGDRPDEAVVSVRDYGIGIAPEHLPRLTERFYRVSVGASREQGGTGLGLAIVKHIVNRHHGRMVIDSETGQGSVFTVRLDTEI